MRNLKRALSLALATVMTLGLMVVGTGAAGYTDVTSEDNQEAIEVLQAVGIMTGVNDDGTEFNPDGLVTRNQMAVIMSQLLNLDYDYYRGINSFTDVPSWAAPYVAACVAEGVTAGIGDGLYGGENNITAAQAALMLMKALGYFQHQGDFTPDWQVATIRQGSYINLFDRVDANAEQALTRSQVAQMVLNALKSDLVTFTGTVGMNINGVEVGYNPEYTARTSAAQKYNRIDTGTTTILSDNGQYYIQLGEELYDGDLSLDYSTDVFGRPAYVWEYDSKEIGTYLDETNMIAEYTEGVTGKDLYELLTRNTVANYGLEVVVDGIYEDEIPVQAISDWWFSKNLIVRSNEGDLGATGTGALTQVFVDNEEKVITVTTINTYLALANSDYSERRGEVSLDVYGLGGTSANGYYRDTDAASATVLRVSSEDFNVSGMLEGDAALVTVADGEVQTIADAEIIANTAIDAFGNGANDNNPNAPDELVIGEAEYDFNIAAQYDDEILQYYTDGTTTNLKDVTYNVYLDPYGNVLGVDEVEGVNNYVFITGVETEGSLLGSNRTVTANAIFLDGQMKPIDVNYKRSSAAVQRNNAMVNSWFTYTVSSSGVYTLTQVTPVTNDDDYVPDSTHNDTKLAQYHQTIVNEADGTSNVIKIDDRNIAVRGFDNIGNSYYRVYGTDETVYLSVGVDVLNNGSNDVAYISEVSSVATGIGNVSLEALSLEDAAEAAEDEADRTGVFTGTNAPSNTNVSNGVYTLYNVDGDVIAAVVVGDDAGASSKLVFTDKGSITREAYNASTGIYTWTRDVVIDGERVTLTEQGDGVSILDTLDQYTWYQVKLDANGLVIDADPYYAVLDANDEYVLDYEDIAAAVADNDTVLYYEDDLGTFNVYGGEMDLTGRTLWVTTERNGGFRVAEDVNVVLIQQNNHKTSTSFETGVSALSSIVTELNDRHEERGNQHTIMVSAILEKGVATSVIIKDTDDACDPYAEGDYDNTGKGELEVLSMNLRTGAITFGLRNDRESIASATFDVTITVRTEDGARVYTGTQSETIAISAGGTDSVTVSALAGGSSIARNYQVTVELVNPVTDKVEYSGTDLVASMRGR